MHSNTQFIYLHTKKNNKISLFDINDQNSLKKNFDKITNKIIFNKLNLDYNLIVHVCHKFNVKIYLQI